MSLWQTIQNVIKTSKKFPKMSYSKNGKSGKKLKEWKKWKETLGKGGRYGAVFIDLSFDSLPEDLSLAKLETYLFSCNYFTPAETGLFWRSQDWLVDPSHFKP